MEHMNLYNTWELYIRSQFQVWSAGLLVVPVLPVVSDVTVFWKYNELYCIKWITLIFCLFKSQKESNIFQAVFRIPKCHNFGIIIKFSLYPTKSKWYFKMTMSATITFIYVWNITYKFPKAVDGFVYQYVLGIRSNIIHKDKTRYLFCFICLYVFRHMNTLWDS